MSTAHEAAASNSATLYIIGLGPGDPELMTVKAERIIRRAEVVAFFAKARCPGHARTIVTGLLSPTCEELRFEYPFTTELSVDDPRYHEQMHAFYDESAALRIRHVSVRSPCAPVPNERDSGSDGHEWLQRKGAPSHLPWQ
jgi:hypothetical protein